MKQNFEFDENLSSDDNIKEAVKSLEDEALEQVLSAHYNSILYIAVNNTYPNREAIINDLLTLIETTDEN